MGVPTVRAGQVTDVAARRQPLDGRWSLRRTGGLVPPLGLLHKRIAGGRGATHLGPVVRLPFAVRVTAGRPELVYAGPLRFVRDRLTPDGEDAWAGEMLVAGRRIGRFRMTRAPRRRRDGT